jgi:hypothetical protein
MALTFQVDPTVQLDSTFQVDFEMRGEACWRKPGFYFGEAEVEEVLRCYKWESLCSVVRERCRILCSLWVQQVIFIPLRQAF